MQGLPLLAPSPYAIGVFPEHYNHGQTLSFKLDQKIYSWSKGDYTVTGVMDSNVAFHNQGQGHELARAPMLVTWLPSIWAVY
jgi:hypothetical protein